MAATLLSVLSLPGFYSSPAQLRTLHTSRGGGVMQGNWKSRKFYEKFCKKDLRKGRERSSDEGRVKYVKKILVSFSKTVFLKQKK